MSLQRNSTFIKQLLLCSILAVGVNHMPAAANAVFEVGEATLPATINNTFTRVTFDNQFVVGTIPNVFPMTTEDGADPCIIRIRNVDHTGFDAVCYEPVNEDGAHPGMMVEYIAIADGTTSVPIAGSSDSLDFRSECITTSRQQYGNACSGCSGTRSEEPVTFTPAFSSTPALLVQVQTTNNPPAPPVGVPPFIATATTNLDANGFDIAIEQLEAGTGPLAVDEEICYLAVERTGCESLDFSSLGGPTTPITFNAVLGNNVDGHNNNCSSGEGATFASGCFSNTPIAVASSRTRQGNDGHVLRRCSVNATEIILTADEDQISDNERSHIDEFVSAFAFSDAFTTPVTLNQASVSLFGRKALFEWQTSAESFHLGFNLWGELEGEWIQLNKKMIRSEQTDYAGIRDYRQRLRLTREQRGKITQFGISTVDNAGYEEFYGPFAAGESYGELAMNEAINWSLTRAAMNAKLKESGYVEYRGRWRRNNEKLAKRVLKKELALDQTVINFTPKNDGINRLSAALILAQVPAWKNKPLDSLALVLNGKAIPRYIQSKNNKLDKNDFIYFAAQTPSGADAIYTQHYNYQMRIDKELSIEASSFDAENYGSSTEQGKVSLGLVKQALSKLNAHSAVLNNGDPWFDTELFTTGNPVSKAYEFTILDQSTLLADMKFAATLFGSIDFPGDQPDHHVQIRVNGSLLEDLWFDGAVDYDLDVSVPKELLQVGVNSITFTLPADTAHPADVVLIDTVEIEFAQSLQGTTHYQFSVGSDQKAIRANLVDGTTESLIAFAFNHRGALSHIENGQFENDGSYVFRSLPYSQDAKYFLGSKHEIEQIEEVSISHPQVLHEVEADLLVISHPLFINSELSAYADFKRDQGLTVSIIDWLDIVDTYGYGNFLPSAINKYLTKVNDYSPLNHVLLVGGHTYDYLGLSGNEVVNYIPTHYRQVGLFGHAPSDNAFADLNNDNLPEFAIGRWPVRSNDDLSHIISKSKRWAESRADHQYQEAILIAQAVDGRGLDFEEQLSGRVALPLSNLAHIADTTMVSMQQLIEEGVENPVGTARAAILDRINNGADIISFAGHASSAAWGFQSIVNTQFIKELNNIETPLIVMPLACYTSNYESPSINTLAHQWLFVGEQGAAAVHGASVLGEHRENAIFAERFLKANHNTNTLGQAILEAKQQLSPNNPMLHNWALLGDPTLPLH